MIRPKTARGCLSPIFPGDDAVDEALTMDERGGAVWVSEVGQLESLVTFDEGLLAVVALLADRRLTALAREIDRSRLLRAWIRITEVAQFRNRPP